MNHLSIRAKLYSITALVSIVLFTLGSIAIYSLRNVNEKSSEISGVWMERVKIADDINTLAFYYRAMQYNYITAATPADKSEAITNLSTLSTQMDKLFNRYIELARDSYRSEIRKTHDEWTTYVKESGDVARPLSDAGKNVEAGTVLRTTLKVKFDAVRDKIIEYGNISIQGAKTASTEADEIYSSASMTLIIVIVIAMIITLVSLITITRSLSNGIAKVLHASERVAEGDLQETISINTNDEIGRLAQSTNKMIENLRRLIQQIQKTSGQVAASSEELTASAEQSSEVTQNIASSVTIVAEMSNKQMQTVSLTSSTVEQMSAGIEETAATISIAAEQSSKALDTAKEGNQAIDNAVKQMNNIESTVTRSADVVAKLGERSKEIGQIVDTISGIAGQTNLLALNAAIEAARAGEQGKGFAVVAEEVRKLAEQSQEAAKQIGNLITEIRRDTDQAVVAMQEGTREVKVGAEVVTSAGGAFVKILDMVSEINNQSTDIAATMEELASGTQEVVNGVQEIDHSGKQVAAEAESVSAATQQQSASMEQIAAASRNLSSLAEQMEQAVGKFKF